MNEQLQAQLLSQLKDVHLPEQVSWWPLAIGWWIVIVVAILVLGVSLNFLWKHYSHNRYRKLAIKELNQHHLSWHANSDDKTYISAANDLLKRVIRIVDPNLVSQFGDNWVDALENHGNTELSQEARYALAYQCYQAHVSADVPSLNAELKHWLKHHKKTPKLTKQEAQHA